MNAGIWLIVGFSFLFGVWIGVVNKDRLEWIADWIRDKMQ